jgi:threonine aldolase
VDLASEIRAEDASTLAREAGLLVNASGPHRLRVVTHLDVTRDDVERGAAILIEIVARMTAKGPRVAPGA